MPKTFENWDCLKIRSQSYDCELHNASAVQIYDAMSSLVRFENKNMFFNF
jgi:hypothetical protein